MGRRVTTKLYRWTELIDTISAKNNETWAQFPSIKTMVEDQDPSKIPEYRYINVGI